MHLEILLGELKFRTEIGLRGEFDPEERQDSEEPKLLVLPRIGELASGDV